MSASTAPGPSHPNIHGDTLDGAIRLFGACELMTIRDRPASYTARRMATLSRVLVECGPVGLLVAPPASVARRIYHDRHDAGRKTRTARGMINALEDFRVWYSANV
jgi:hypothetical protein